MKNMTLDNIARVTHGQLFYPDGVKADPYKCIEGVVTDNRKIEKDYLFIPVIGENADGHTFIDSAFEMGAYATLSMRKLENPKGPYILVENSLQALIEIATFYRQQLTIPVVGIIGSVGKTSTKEMVASVLSTRYNVLKTDKNLNNSIGLPLTICSIRDYHKAAVVEMGISDFGEMDVLGDIAKPDMVVMTNIGQCHLKQLKDRDGILRAKSEVFKHMPSDGVAILNADDDKLSGADTLGLKTVYYGESSDYITAKNIKLTSMEATGMLLITPQGQADVTIPLAGRHNCINAMAAAAVAVELGLSISEIAQGIENVKAIEGRNNFIDAAGITIIDDCYNANPVSMKSSIEVLSKAKGRTIAILGDMGELGEDEKSLHYEIAKTIDECSISILFAVGELTNEIVRGLMDCNASCRFAHYDDVDEMLMDVIPSLNTGDTVLVKASHFMNFSKVVKAIQEARTKIRN